MNKLDRYSTNEQLIIRLAILAEISARFQAGLTNRPEEEVMFELGQITTEHMSFMTHSELEDTLNNTKQGYVNGKKNLKRNRKRNNN